MAGQPQLHSNPFIGIDTVSFNVTDPSGTASQYIIRSGDPIGVKVSFKAGDSFALPLLSLPVKYQVDIYLDALGTGVDGMLVSTGPTLTTPVPAPNGAGEYQYDVNLPPTPWVHPGVYRTTAIVRMLGFPMTAFVEGPIIEIF
jgi:hypothetical protein